MAVKAERSVEPPAILPYALSEEWIARIGRLQDALAVCPADILARCELATLLEKLEQPEEALCQLERGPGLRSQQSEGSGGGGSMSATNRAATAVRSVRGIMPTIWGYLEKVDKLIGAFSACPGEDILTWRNRHTGSRQHWGTDSHRQRNRAG